MTKKQYSALLKHPKWRQKRIEILEMDNYMCRRCGKRKANNVHHRYYENNKNPWDYDNSVLISLCAYCHSIEHKYKPLTHFTIIKDIDKETINLPIDFAKKRVRIDELEAKHRNILAKMEKDFVFDDNYQKTKFRLKSDVRKIIDIIDGIGESAIFMYNNPTLLDEYTKSRIYITFYLPKQNIAIIRKKEHYEQIIWCVDNKIPFICTEDLNDEELNTTIVRFIKKNIRPFSTFYNQYFLALEDRQNTKVFYAALEEYRLKNEQKQAILKN